MPDSRTLIERLQAELDSWPCAAVPGVLAAVQSPTIGLDWAGAAGQDAGAVLSPEHCFRIASVTKLHVAAAVLRLCEDSALGLESPAAHFLSDAHRRQLASGGYDAAAMRIHHLLSHTSGLRDHAEESYKQEVLRSPQRRWTRTEQIDWCLQLGAPLAEPGTVFSYSDTGYVLLGEVIEAVTGEALGPAVRRMLGLDELGLSQTWWEAQEPAPDSAWPRCSQYIEKVNGRDFNPAFDLYGGGGLISSTGDLARFVRALIRGEVFQRETTLATALLVPPAQRADEAHIHSRLAMALPMGRGWGWGHLGFWGAATAYNPEHDLGVALSLNQAERGDPLMLTRCLQRLAGCVMEAAA